VITLLIALMVLLCTVLTILRKRAALYWGCASIILIFLAGSGVANPWIDRWSVRDPAQAAPAIENELIVLLGVGIEHTESGNTPAYFALPRILAAQQAYESCKSTTHGCHILISGGTAGGYKESEAAVYKRSLVQASNIPDSDITLEEASRNTWENAKFSTSWIKEHRYTAVRLVTSLIHMRRSMAYFENFGVSPLGTPSEVTVGRPTYYPTAWNLMVLDIFMHEQMGIARFNLYNLLGWND
jgi:uncharacterized SAM-binding protein YcdF (DUF218 family)